MSQGRRAIDRRRRVLYSAAAEMHGTTAAGRREVARLREARCPEAMYGSRVENRLRGRWFSLVPVRRRTITAVAVLVMGLAGLLCGAHYAAVAWPSVAHHGDIARPLRLDRPDSFGRWLIGILMLATAGASFLIFQLRRHRLDDFRGHYQLWRLLIVVLLLSSLNSVTGLIDWGGALIDAALGRRVAMAGADWFRIAVTLGGTVLLIRLLAEVRRAPMAVLFLLTTAVMLALPEAARWRVIEVESIGRWTIITAAPLLAFTAMFISCLAYLRMLYREVRRLNETDTLKGRLEEMKLRVFQRDEQNTEEEYEEEPADEVNNDRSRKRRWWQRNRDTTDQSDQHDEEDSVAEGQAGGAEAEEADEVRKPKRRWFGLRSGKSESGEPAEAEAENEPAEQSQPKKRRRFSLRLAPQKRTQTDDEDDQLQTQVDKQTKPTPKPASRDEAGSDEDWIDPEEIDWSSLSKSERRRLRKKLKRQNRAA